MKLTALISLTLGALPALAADATRLHYTARVHGLALLDIAVCIRLDPGSFTADLRARTLGLAELLAHGRTEAHAEGLIDGATVKPRAYIEHSRLSGETYTVDIGYVAGTPVLRAVSPPEGTYRSAVPRDDLAGALDGLSAISLATLVVTRTGACQGQVLIYDGRQLRRATTHAVGRETLVANHRLTFSGPTLRCETQSDMLAGYVKDQAIKPQAAPRYSTVWFGSVRPGGPALPVRMLFDADYIGDITVDLDAASNITDASCAGAVDETPPRRD